MRATNPCVYRCGRISCHYTLFVCDNKRKFGACFPLSAEDREWTDRAWLEILGVKVDPLPTRGNVSIEIVMQGAAVRKARELHAMRKRKPLIGERRASECGELDLGEIL